MKLKKELNLIEVYSIASGTMISSGIFILPGLAYAITGPSVFISYILAGLVALTGALSIIELSTAMPKAGGDYYFITRSFGPLVGTISGFLSWAALSLKSAFAIFGLALFVQILTGINFMIIASIVTIIFVIINIIGVKIAGIVEVYLVAFLFVIMIGFIIIGFPKVNIQNFIPFTKDGLVGILSTAGFVFVSYGGLLKVSSVSEEVKDPKKNIPRGLIASLISVIFIYALLLIVTIGVSGNKLAGDSEPIANAARIIMGKPGYIALIIAGLLAFITTANAGIMSAARYPMALSRDNLLPHAISRVNKRFQTPVFSILMTGTFIILVLLLPLEFLVKTASAVILTTYILATLSVIVLRESRVQNYMPSFKSSLYPWMHIIGIILYVLLIIDIEGSAKVFSLIGIVFGILIYFIYGRKQANQESAMVHLLARITNKEIKTTVLEDELRDVLHQRDNVIHDNIDKLIHDSKVFDIEEELEIDDLFKFLSEELSAELKMFPEKMFTLLKNREEESSTVITPFVAIPHIIIEGKDLFKIVIVRAKIGVNFSETSKNIKAVFLLLGSKDNRNFHLKTLAAIAQILQNKHFEEYWINAKNENQLKDILLLSDRTRH